MPEPVESVRKTPQVINARPRDFSLAAAQTVGKGLDLPIRRHREYPLPGVNAAVRAQLIRRFVIDESSTGKFRLVEIRGHYELPHSVRPSDLQWLDNASEILSELHRRLGVGGSEQ